MTVKILDNNNLPEWLPFGATKGKSGKIEYSESNVAYHDKNELIQSQAEGVKQLKLELKRKQSISD